jgi:hypothetical protein
VFSVNLQRAESFSHHRIGIDNKDSHEHLVDSKELQETSIAPIDTQSDELVDSEEEKIVKRHVLLQPSTGHSSEEEDTTTDSKNESIEDSVDSKEIKLVKRDVQFTTTTTDGHSSEEDVTTVPTISLEDLSVEDDADDAEDKKKVKRNVQVEMTSIDHSSEEERYAAIVGQMNQSDEHDYDNSAELFKREIHQLTAGELEMLFQLFHSEEYGAANGTFIGSHSDEHHDYFGPIEKRQSGLLATTTGGRSSEEMDDRFDHSFENSMEDVYLRD